jgi:general secretion pathway protein B
MSLILDALKKLDREKVARRVGQTDIAAEILKAGHPAQKSSILPLVFVLAITASLAAASTYLIFSGSGTQVADSRPAVPAASMQAQQVTAAVTDKPPVNPRISPAAPPVSVSEAMPPDKTKKLAEPAVSARISADVVAPRKAVAVPEGEGGPLPTLKISGIVWQETPSERKAVINGKLAREGDVVEGVKILEIYPDRILVSHRGKSFKIMMFE